MRNKLLIFSLITVVGVTALVLVAGVAVFALTREALPHPEEAQVDQPLEVMPVEVEPVTVINPVFEHERSKYTGVDAEGGCPHSQQSKAQLVEAETPAEDQMAADQLLTLAE